jgi:hypothetical protein
MILVAGSLALTFIFSVVVVTNIVISPPSFYGCCKARIHSIYVTHAGNVLTISLRSIGSGVGTVGDEASVKVMVGTGSVEEIEEELGWENLL